MFSSSGKVWNSVLRSRTKLHNTMSCYFILQHRYGKVKQHTKLKRLQNVHYTHVTNFVVKFLLVFRLFSVFFFFSIVNHFLKFLFNHIIVVSRTKKSTEFWLFSWKKIWSTIKEKKNLFRLIARGDISDCTNKKWM